jgi:hypothetical protein
MEGGDTGSAEHFDSVISNHCVLLLRRQLTTVKVYLVPNEMT